MAKAKNAALNAAGKAKEDEFYTKISDFLDSWGNPSISYEKYRFASFDKGFSKHHIVYVILQNEYTFFE